LSDQIELSQADLNEIARYHYSTSLYEFMLKAWEVLEPDELVVGWHLRAICDHLEAVSRGELPRLAISIPPGFCKSMLVSVIWPAWEWTHSPHLKFLTTSSSEDFCTRDADKMRMLITSDWYAALWPLTFPRIDTVLRFQNDRLGERWGKSFTSLTGGRANRLILDDVLSVDNANSEAERIKVSRRFFESATSRLSRETDAIVIIMQRVHEDDLIGEIRERQAKGEDLGFEFLTIPMEYEGDANETSIGYSDPRTEPGELLLPEYRSRRWVDREKITMGPYAWAAQYQQEPSPRGNGFFDVGKFLKYKADELPKRLNYYMTSDHADGGKDYNVFRIWALDEHKHYWLVDSFRERCRIQIALGIITEGGKIRIAQRGAFALLQKYRPICWYADNDAIINAQLRLIEDTMRATGVVTRMEIVRQGQSKKRERASALDSYSRLGMIHLPDNHMGETALAEYAAFSDTCRHDDQVDADGLLPRMAVHPAFVPPVAERKASPDYVVDIGGGGMSDAYHCF
jgi:hypothetical protein